MDADQIHSRAMQPFHHNACTQLAAMQLLCHSACFTQLTAMQLFRRSACFTQLTAR
jgi:hypothetical protein